MTSYNQPANQRSGQQLYSGRYESHVIPQQGYPQQQQPSPKLNLPRSISTTNLETTGRCRTVIKQDWVPNAPVGGTNFFTSTPCYTFTLPSLEGYPPEFKKFVFDCIVDKETQRFLEGEQYLNWCPSATKLVPLTTMGDGNCLLHAASLGMWGFQDREHVIRRAVSQALFNHNGNTFYERWKFSREQELLHTGTQLEPHQWHHEWQETVRLASAEVTPGKSLDSLEEFHVFVLANILRRPIIMYASPKMKSAVNDATLQGLNFHGVYLPLLWDPKSCKKDPLPLAYYGGHFSALTVIESPQHYPGGFMLPLCDYYGVQLPVRYSLPVEDSTSLLMDYLNLVQVRGTGSPYITTSHMICAKLTIPESPAYLQPLISGFIDACREVFVQPYPPKGMSSVGNQALPNSFGDGRLSQGPQEASSAQEKCINGCGLFGDPNKAGLCSQCFRKAQDAAHAQEKAAEEEKQQQQQQQQQQGSLPSGAIKCPHCANPGQPMYLGMCEACYHQTTKPGGSAVQVRATPKQNEPIYETLPNIPPKGQASGLQPQPPALPPPRSGVDSQGRANCRMPGCEFFGTRETRFYCSKCFENNMEKILKEADDGQPLQYPVEQHGRFINVQQSLNGGQREPPKCNRCHDFYANEEYNGLCHSCFINMTKTETHRPQNQFGRDSIHQKVVTEPIVSMQQMQGHQQPMAQKCLSPHCISPASSANGYCEKCEMTQTLPDPVPQTQSYRPVPKPRTKHRLPSDQQSEPYQGRGITTAPVKDIPPANDSAHCFLCNAGTNIGGVNTVCEQHARQMRATQVHHSPNIGDGMVRQKPTHQSFHAPAEQMMSPLGGPSNLVQSSIPLYGNGNNGTNMYMMSTSTRPSQGLMGNEVSPPHSVQSGAASGYPQQVNASPGFICHSTPGHMQQSLSPTSRQHFNQSFTNAGSQEAVATGQGATGSSGAQGSTTPMDVRPAKLLCATSGCSFKGYSELNGYCPDCCGLPNVPSDKFPLV